MDEYYMNEAIKEAEEAFRQDEVPIGCVIVRNGEIIARAHNTKIQDNNSLAHAEINALIIAQRILNTKYLYDCEMFVTLEPCAMCTGAVINARLGRLVYALREPKTGCCGSQYNLPEDNKFNHKVEIKSGVEEQKVKEMMQSFFASKRGNK